MIIDNLNQWRLKRILYKYSGSKEKLSKDSSLKGTLLIDSLSYVMIVAEVEKRFKVDFKEELILNENLTYGDLMSIIKRRKKNV